MYFQVQQVFIEHLLYPVVISQGELAFVAGERHTNDNPAYVTDDI